MRCATAHAIYIQERKYPCIKAHIFYLSTIFSAYTLPVWMWFQSRDAAILRGRQLLMKLRVVTKPPLIEEFSPEMPSVIGPKKPLELNNNSHIAIAMKELDAR